MLTSPNSPTKFLYIRTLYVQVHCVALNINRKAKPAYYPVQLVDLDDFNDQHQEWFPK